MTAESELAALRRHIGSLLARRGLPADFGDGESLVRSHRLESMDVVSIILRLEKSFGFNLHEHGLDADSVDTFKAIRALVDRFAR